MRHRQNRTRSRLEALLRTPGFAAAVGFGVLFTAAILSRLALLRLPLERDEGEYAYVGQLLLRGLSPYVHAYTMKLPGTHLIYAALLAAFGQNALAIRLGLFLTTIATAAFVMLLALELFPGAAAALCAGATFAVLALNPTSLGFAAHATQFVALFTAAGSWLLLKAARTGDLKQIFVCGLLFGCAVLVKQHAALICLLPLVWLDRKVTPRRKLALATFGTGLVLPYASLCAALWHAGAWNPFWSWTVDYASSYANKYPLIEAPQRFLERFAMIARPNAALWIAVLAGAIVPIPPTARLREARWFLLLFSGAALLAVLPGFVFHPHYFIVLFPAAALLAGHFIAARGYAWRTLLMLGALGLSFALQWVFYLSLDSTSLFRRIYSTAPFAESVPIAAFIREHTRPEDRIAVVGSEPQLYFLSQRLAATRYLYGYPLVELQPHARAMQQELISELEANSPSMIIIDNVPSSWVVRPESERAIFRWLDEKLPLAYELVGAVAIRPNRPTEYFWGREQARSYLRGPRVVDELLLFSRRTKRHEGV